MSLPAMSLLAASSAPDAGPARIAYVTNAWFPKIDGAAITVMGHAQYFAQAGHPVRGRGTPRTTGGLTTYARA